MPGLERRIHVLTVSDSRSSTGGASLVWRLGAASVSGSKIVLRS